MTVSQDLLDALRGIKDELRARIRTGYEHAALDCARCPRPGACCTDAHFVNVHVTRIEAVAIRDRLRVLGPEVLAAATARARAAIDDFGLGDAGDTYAQTYACPLYVAGLGCLVHEGGAKPIPCIHHACYEREEDLPPLALQTAAEQAVRLLDAEAFGAARARSIPLWLVGEDALDDP